MTIIIPDFGFRSMLFDAQPDLIKRQIKADLAICDATGTELHVLNATAAKVFQLCDGSHTPEQMAETLVESFEGVEYDRACEDVKRVLVVLEKKNLILVKK
ncbi:PqqD family protein [Candidatus Poribacteria bacterium]